jgi:hypothetical protein
LILNRLIAVLPDEIDRELWALDQEFREHGAFSQPCATEEYERRYRTDWHCKHSVRRQRCSECRVSPPSQQAHGWGY